MPHDDVKQPHGLIKVIVTSSAGTLIEWYDFYVFAALAPILATQFFGKGGGNSGLFQVLAIYATGMIVRPFGAMFFGRMGDIVGRKHTFLLTLVMMGACSTGIGLLPGYQSIGILAPILLVVLRLIQGLALGGEYGGAATYLAENAPPGHRGFYTSFVQITASAGLLLSLLLILALRTRLDEGPFAAWGWRIPFLLSGVLVVFSYLVRRSMAESPLFSRLKATGGTSKNPLVESFTNPENRKKVLIALFGLTAGQGVVWHAGHFNSLFFLQSTLKVAMPQANQIVAWAILFGAPFFVVFGALSDRIGRKKIVMAGFALAVVGYMPIYLKMDKLAWFDPYNHAAPVFHQLSSSASPGQPEVVTKTIEMTDSAGVTEKTQYQLNHLVGEVRGDARKVEISVPRPTFWMLVGLVWIQVILATMVYGPMAAFLVEMFPTRIRYTSLSVPYHLGNGLFGGLVPLIGTWLVAKTQIPEAAIFYPTAIAAMSLVVGMLYVRETRAADATPLDA